VKRENLFSHFRAEAADAAGVKSERRASQACLNEHVRAAATDAECVKSVQGERSANAAQDCKWLMLLPESMMLPPESAENGKKCYQSA